MNINSLKKKISGLATAEHRWYALIFIALGLAIVIIDNTILNVSIPYMLRDLGTSLPAIEWAISGYALTIATVLITAGRLGDMWGRKKIFLLGIVIFALGSIIGSEARSVTTLIIGRGIIQAIGAAMSLTSALSLLASTFHGRERAIAFGIWGSIAGASAAIGPLLGGYLTTYHSWRWSLRINVIVGIIAILGSVFIRESKGEGVKKFDWQGMFLSGAGLFCLVFGVIEGGNYGWLHPLNRFSVGGWTWPLNGISVIPFFFLAAALFLAAFIRTEYRLELKHGTPMLKMSMFKNRSFSLGLAILAILACGQLGTFFILPIYLENVLSMSALQTGIVFLSASVTIFVIGPLSGVIASRIGTKWAVIAGMFFLPAGLYLLSSSVSVSASALSLAPALIMFGIGIGAASSQLSNTILSSAPSRDTGEASAAMTTMRQVGSSIGIAVIGAIFAGSLLANISANVRLDPAIPAPAKNEITRAVAHIDLESGSIGPINTEVEPRIARSFQDDLNRSFVASSRNTIRFTSLFVLMGAILSLLLPTLKPEK